MDTAHTKEREVLLEQARALSANERTAFLDKACNGDAALRAELASMLAVSEQPDAYRGTTVSHYVIQEKLGGGGMGVVYKARDSRLNRSVALKFLPPHLSTNEDAKARFTHEARAASALDHPNIATIHEIGETNDGQFFIAMAFYEGETLKKKIARGPLPVEEALDYATQVARGLAKSHAHGIIHRDVKPANVMITKPTPAESGNSIAKVLDFGLAKMAGIQLTRTGTTLGTVAYMSPEQARGEAVDHRTDLWALGVVLYEMLTGERPFKGDYPDAVIYGVLHEEPTPLSTLCPEVPTCLAEIVASCLAKKPENRYQNAATLLADLKGLHGDANVALAPSQSPSRWYQRPVSQIAGAGLTLALILLFAFPASRTAVLDQFGVPTLPTAKHMAVLTVGTSMDPMDSEDPLLKELGTLLPQVLLQLSPFAPTSLTVVPDIEMSDVTTVSDAYERFRIQQAITTSLSYRGDEVHVRLSLVDAEHLRQLGTAVVIASTDSIATLQADLIGAVANLLEIPLTASDRRALTERGPANATAYEFYQKGLTLLKQIDKPENIDTAIQLFTWAIQEDSLYAEAHAGLAEAYWRKYNQEGVNDPGWVTRAQQQQAKATALGKHRAPVHVMLGRLQAGTGAYEEAIVEYNLALALDSTNADAYRGLAKAYTNTGRTEEAKISYQRAIQSQPDYWLPYNDLGEFYLIIGENKNAETQFRKVLELSPNNVWGHNNLGVAYYSQGQVDKAQDQFERVLTIRSDLYALSNLGYIALYQERYTDAAQMFQRALAIDSTDYITWGNLASAYEGIPQKQDSAYVYYRRAAKLAEAPLAVNPNDPDILSNLATYYTNVGRKKEAKDLLNRALAATPHDIYLMYLAGTLYEQMGERDEALEWIIEALKHGYPLSEIENLPALEQLRQDPRYQQVLKWASNVKQ